MAYMRIASGKFWAWVVVSLLVGLAIGLTIMLVRTGSLGDKVTVLEHQLASASAGTTETIAAIQTQLMSAEASVTALTQQNEQLSADLAAASSGSGSGSTSTATETVPALVVVSRTVTPSSVATSGAITMTAKVKGAPTTVVMRVYNSSKSFDKTYTLKKVSTSGSTQTWRLKVHAPTIKGTFHYFATAKKGSVRVTMKGVSASSFTVK